MICVIVDSHLDTRLSDETFVPGHLNGADERIVHEKSVRANERVDQWLQPVVQVRITVGLPSNARDAVSMDGQRYLRVDDEVELPQSPS